jgi:hypothetical protein
MEAMLECYHSIGTLINLTSLILERRYGNMVKMLDDEAAYRFSRLPYLRHLTIKRISDTACLQLRKLSKLNSLSGNTLSIAVD